MGKLVEPPSVQNALVQMVDTTRKGPNSNRGQPDPRIQKRAPMDSIEPMAYSLGGTGMFSGNVMSDTYSVWDTSPEQLLAQGSGGCMQMHNYVNPDYIDNITQAPETVTRAPRMDDTITVENLQKQRNTELSKIGVNK